MYEKCYPTKSIIRCLILRKYLTQRSYIEIAILLHKSAYEAIFDSVQRTKQRLSYKFATHNHKHTQRKLKYELKKKSKTKQSNTTMSERISVYNSAFAFYRTLNKKLFVIISNDHNEPILLL